MVSVLQRGSIARLCKRCTSRRRDVRLSDRPSVRLLRSGIVSKRRKLGSRSFRHQVGQGFWFSADELYP